MGLNRKARNNAYSTLSLSGWKPLDNLKNSQKTPSGMFYPRIVCNAGSTLTLHLTDRTQSHLREDCPNRLCILSTARTGASPSTSRAGKVTRNQVRHHRFQSRKPIGELSTAQSSSALKHPRRWVPCMLCCGSATLESCDWQAFSSILSRRSLASSEQWTRASRSYSDLPSCRKCLGESILHPCKGLMISSSVLQ